MRAQLASLPPLCPAKLPQVSKDSSTSSGGPNTGIYRRTDQLLATLLKLSADVKVVDVTGKTAGDELTLYFSCLLNIFTPTCLGYFLKACCLNSVSASVQLLEQTARLQNLSDALDKLKVFTFFSSPSLPAVKK